MYKNYYIVCIKNKKTASLEMQNFTSNVCIVVFEIAFNQSPLQMRISTISSTAASSFLRHQLKPYTLSHKQFETSAKKDKLCCYARKLSELKLIMQTK
jgi:hypothetical protein